MALNPAIPLGLVLPKAQDPMEQYERGVNLRSLLDQRTQQQAQAQQQQALFPLQQQQAQINLQNAQLQQDTLKKNAAQAERSQKDLDIGQQAFQSPNSFDTGPDGVPKYNQDKFEANFIKMGGSPQGLNDFRTQRANAIEAMSKQQTAVLAAENARHESVRNGLNGITDDDSQMAIVHKLQDIGALTAPDANSILSTPYGPEKIQNLVRSHSTLAEMTQKAKDDADLQEKATQQRASTINAYKSLKDLGIPGEQIPGLLNLSADQKQMISTLASTPQRTQADWSSAIDTVAPPGGEYAETNRVAKAALTQAYMGPGNRDQAAATIYANTLKQLQDLAKTKAESIARANQSTQNATEEDYKDAGAVYAMTGVMPPLGLAAGGRTKVLHYGMQYARDNNLTPRDLALAKSAYAGDTRSLAALQQQRDAVTAFEGTALANANLFLNTAKGVIDSGSPWINKPLRTVSEKGLGASDLSALRAARQVAINEIARVTSNPNLTGVLSDTARKEIEALVPQDATLKQMYDVVSVLKQDMANRHYVQDATLGIIRDRIGSFGQGSFAVPVPPSPATYTGPPTPINYKGKKMGYQGTPEQAQAAGYTLWTGK